MQASEKITSSHELHFTIPKELRETFMDNGRIYIDWGAPGYWPVDPGVLLKAGLLEKLATNAEFGKQFQIVIIPKNTMQR